jgi:hypothetical protein
MSEEYDQLQAITGLLVSATITISVASDRLIQLAAEYPEAALGDLPAAIAQHVAQMTTTINQIGEMLKGQAQ